MFFFLYIKKNATKQRHLKKKEDLQSLQSSSIM